MIRPVLLSVLVLCPTLAAAKPWKPHPIKVIPGVPLKAEDIKPYTPPKLLPEPPLEPSDVKVVQVSTAEAVIQMRPWSSPMVGNAIHGARLPVRGVVKTTRGGCSSKVWYALEPFGYLCGREGNPTDQPATTEQVLKVREGSRLPFQYVMALVKEGDKIPMWTTLEDLKKGSPPERQLERGDTVAVDKPYTHDGEKYWITVDAKVTPQKGFAMMGAGASWHGITLDESVPLPFGWVTPEKTNAYATPPQKGDKAVPVMQIERRTRLTILDEQLVNKRKWLKVTVAAPPPPPTFGEIMADAAKRAAAATTAAAATPAAAPTDGGAAAPAAPGNLWVSADALNEVRKLAPPKTIQPGVEKWIDVDLGEQVLVTYEGEKPLFATLVSSGRAIATPMGTYPVWAKVSAITMKNQPYEDKGYYVNKVPWSTFFQWHNAIHGAYWHDRFGVSKSHGCVNVAPLDAKHVFEWVTPPLPPGWTGLRPLDLVQSPHVVVRNSHAKKEFRQDRPIGPPDRGLEAERLEEAEKRRSEEAQAAAAAATATPGAPGTPAPVVPPPATPSVVPAPSPAQPAPQP